MIFTIIFTIIFTMIFVKKLVAKQVNKQVDQFVKCYFFNSSYSFIFTVYFKIIVQYFPIAFLKQYKTIEKILDQFNYR